MNNEKIKFPKRTFVMLMLTYLIPSLLYGFIARGMGALTQDEFNITLADPVIYILLLFQVATPIITYKFFTKRMYFFLFSRINKRCKQNGKYF